VEDVGWGTALFLAAGALLTVVVLFGVADRHLELGRLQLDAAQFNQRFQETRAASDLATLIQGLLDVSMYLSGIVVALYGFVLLFLVLMGLALLIGDRLPRRWATPWGVLAALPLFILPCRDEPDQYPSSAPMWCTSR
jgi:hypothetical protein